MATFSKRVYKSWRVSAPNCSDLSKAFDAPSDAAAYAGELKNAGHEYIQIKPVASTRPFGPMHYASSDGDLMF